MFVNALHDWKALDPIDVTLLGILILANDEHEEKA